MNQTLLLSWIPMNAVRRDEWMPRFSVNNDLNIKISNKNHKCTFIALLGLIENRDVILCCTCVSLPSGRTCLFVWMCVWPDVCVRTGRPIFVYASVCVSVTTQTHKHIHASSLHPELCPVGALLLQHPWEESHTTCVLAPESHSTIVLLLLSTGSQSNQPFLTSDFLIKWV